MMTTPPRLAFVVSSPRAGSTLLERMLEAHSRVLGGPEPHLMTPLAHLGLWARADKAPYDIDGAAGALESFVAQLPRGEDDYYAAIRAYCDTLYCRWLATAPDAALCLDKTPAYTLILPFLERVYPDAAYIVLTRHPLATFASYANSFFDGDYAAAHAYNPLLERYVPALARFVSQAQAARLHIRYEDLVTEPTPWMQRSCEHLGIDFEPGMITYGAKPQTKTHAKGLGDPIGVARYDRPVTDSVEKWVTDLAGKPDALRLMQGIVGRLAPDDLAALGYPLETLWEPLEAAKGRPLPPAKKPAWTRYRLQRVAIMRLRDAARRFPPFRAALTRASRHCDAVLRAGRQHAAHLSQR